VNKVSDYQIVLK